MKFKLWIGILVVSIVVASSLVTADAENATSAADLLRQKIDQISARITAPIIAEEVSIEMVKGSNGCRYDSKTDMDRCSTTYIVCDTKAAVINDDISFLYKEQKESYERIDKFSNFTLNVSVEKVKKGDCTEVTVSGMKNQFIDIDNVPCYKEMCAYEFAWWNSSWGYREVIHVNSTGTKSFNITINISIDTAALITAGKLEADCDDVRFVNSTGDVFVLAFEWENITDATYGCNNANSIIHVNVPALDGNNRSIAFYYGNADVSSGEDITGTWADYAAQYVYHLDQQGTGTDIFSSTGNFDGVWFTGAPTWLASGHIGPGIDCDSTKADRLNSTFELGVDYIAGDNFTTMLWFKEAPGATDAYRCMLASGGGPDWAMCFDGGDAISDDDTVGFRIGSSTWGHTGAAPDYSDGKWHHLVMGDNDATGAFAYVDGGLADTQPVAGTWERGFVDYCYRAAGGLGNFEGELDEIRTYNYAMNADQIKRIFEHQRAYIQGEEEVPTGDSCTYSSGNWVIQCADNCSITDNTALAGNDLVFNGTGKFSVLANITNTGNVLNGLSEGCRIQIYNQQRID